MSEKRCNILRHFLDNNHMLCGSKIVNFLTLSFGCDILLLMKWKFPYIHRWGLEEAWPHIDAPFQQGFNFRWTSWSHGPSLVFFWKTRYHEHRWLLMFRYPPLLHYDDMQNLVRYYGFRTYQFDGSSIGRAPGC